ncbi:riboflavin biosynthesis protein RibD [Nonlabens spongiae]|uniref:Riboflavin biosynthesis protein RibD n=1 Tax=Nonlabens spongiae TaxID=331648 RepID=A0A1W6MNJ2_9FLAO|nr:bifunctional diaminohydroxyphosphoribosylaminopyrimidine deaminase/5-amino-6-(5-phosphoribosylamino)uracil reductase RibD [Nonlabens spongiae]ARN79183.1 riboflavin biosynthesis protein RibD [Nonlabens spongiae]
MQHHEKYMQRCLELAKNGLGTTYPNPLVGSVIFNSENKIIGEGWHYQSGQPHAEVNAVLNAENKGHSDFSDATIYVNLEPCSHTGKTPPCASMIIKKGFKKVVIGTLDPHDKVAGRGVKLLESAGIKCIIGVLSNECKELNRRFFTYHRKRRPYVILKWAETSDGYIAPLKKLDRSPVWITNSYSKQRAHKLRAQEQAILVGAKTVIDDNPSLTCRSWKGFHPTRVVLDSLENLSKDSAVFSNEAQTLILNRKTREVDGILSDLFQNGIQSVIIEGGVKTIQEFIDKGMWDEAYQFMGTEVLFHEGVQTPKLSGKFLLHTREIIENDVLKIYRKS